MAWLAGLIEGEGTIIFTQKNSVALTIFMTDEDVLRQCQKVTGAGTVRGPYQDKRGTSRQPIWKWSVAKGSHVEALLTAIYPRMGRRRKIRIEAALERLSHLRGKERCQQGHENWRLDARGRRYCRDCATIAQRLRRSGEK